MIYLHSLVHYFCHPLQNMHVYCEYVLILRHANSKEALEIFRHCMGSDVILILTIGGLPPFPFLILLQQCYTANWEGRSY